MVSGIKNVQFSKFGFRVRNNALYWSAGAFCVMLDAPSVSSIKCQKGLHIFVRLIVPHLGCDEGMNGLSLQKVEKLQE